MSGKRWLSLALPAVCLLCLPSMAIAQGVQRPVPIGINSGPVSGVVEDAYGVWFTFTIPDELPVGVRVTGYTIETSLGTLPSSVLELYTGQYPDGLTLMAQDGNGAQGYPASITRQLESGTYFFKVRGWARRHRGTFEVSVRMNTEPIYPPPPGPGVQRPVPIGINAGPVSGVIERRGRKECWFTFTIPSEPLLGVRILDYTVETTLGTLPDSVIELYTGNYPNGLTLVADDDDSGVGYGSRISRLLDPGTYFVKVRGYDRSDAGTFEISVTMRTQPVYPVQRPVPIGVNAGPVSGIIEGRGRREAWFTFTVSNSENHVVETTLGTLRDSVIELYSGLYPDCLTLIAQDDDGGTQNYASRILRALRPGRYFAKVRGYDRRMTGSFDISVRTERIVAQPSGAPRNPEDGAGTGILDRLEEVD